MSMISEVLKRIKSRDPVHVYERDYFYRDCLETITQQDRENAVKLSMSMTMDHWNKLTSCAGGRNYLFMIMHICDPKNEKIGCSIRPRNVVTSLANWMGVKL